MLCTRKCRNDSDMMPFNTENNFDLICGAFMFQSTKVSLFILTDHNEILEIRRP